MRGMESRESIGRRLDGDIESVDMLDWKVAEVCDGWMKESFGWQMWMHKINLSSGR